MPEGFVPLADLLRASREPVRIEPDRVAPTEEEKPAETDERVARRLRARLAMACGFGRVFDANGASLDDGPPLSLKFAVAAVPLPLERSALDRPLWTGVRAIDALLTIARGARVGVFGAPGTGKSSLLEAIARGTSADALVIALVGERGREAEQWIRTLDERRVAICATGDRDASERVGACEAAFAHAHALRARGLHVLLVVDSLARYANALRELAIERGEATGRGGFPPSVFARIARTVESAGAVGSGSVTAIVSVLDDGDDRDPVSDAARSLLDGHVALSSERAGAGRFPAIDILASSSRTMNAASSVGHREAAGRVRAAMAWLARTSEARSLGIASAEADGLRFLAAEAAVEALLAQGPDPEPSAATLARLAEVADTIGE